MVCLSLCLSAPYRNQCQTSYFLASVSATWYYTSLLWSIGCCQNMIVIRWPVWHDHKLSGVDPLRLHVSAYKLLAFSWPQAQLPVDFFTMVTNYSYKNHFKEIHLELSLWSVENYELPASDFKPWLNLYDKLLNYHGVTLSLLIMVKEIRRSWQFCAEA